jgi:hypothetical protein
MRSLLQLLRQLPKPVLVGTLLSVIVIFLVWQFPALQPVREPGDVAISGLIGFLAGYGRRPDSWRLDLLSGLVAALVVAGLRLGFAAFVGEAPDLPIGLDLARAGLAGAMGAMVARLLHQRVAI